MMGIPALLLVVFLVWSSGKKTPVDYYVLKKIDVNYTILGNCIVDYPDPLDITLSQEGSVTSVLMKEGDIVKKGQKIILLDNFTEKQNLTISYNNLIASEAKMKNAKAVTLPKLREQLNSDTVSLNEASAALDRMQVSFQSGGVSKAELESAQNNFKKAQAQYNGTKLTLDSFESSGPIAEIVSQTQILQAQHELAEKSFNEKTVVSPFDGTILSLKVQPGQKVRPGTVIVTLIEKKNWMLSLNVDQKELPFLKMGSPAEISLDAYPDRKLKAAVNYLCTEVDKQKGTCELRLEIRDPAVFIKHGMTGSVEIFAEKFSQIPAVPSRFVRKQNGGDAVCVWDGKKAILVSVTVKPIGERWKILDSVKEGSILLDATGKMLPSKLMPGKEVSSL